MEMEVRISYALFALTIAGCASFSAAGNDPPDASTSDAADGGLDAPEPALRPVGTPSSLGGAPFPQAVGVAVSASTIFISTGASITARPKSDTVQDFGTVLVGNLDGSQYVAVGSMRVFWAESGTTKAVSRASQEPPASPVGMNGTQAGLASPSGVALAEGTVWATDYGGGKLFSFDKDANGAEVKFASVQFPAQNPEGIAADGKTLYIALNGVGKIVSVDSGNPIAATPVVDAPGVAGLAVDPTTHALYWTSQEAPFGVLRWRKGMPSPERVAECESLPVGIAVDDANVYWIVRDSLTATLWRAAK